MFTEKKLIEFGDDSALEIDDFILEQMGIDPNTPLEIFISENSHIVITPIRSESSQESSRQ